LQIDLNLALPKSIAHLSTEHIAHLLTECRFIRRRLGRSNLCLSEPRRSVARLLRGTSTLLLGIPGSLAGGSWLTCVLLSQHDSEHN
jgi:hypothetical protein